jgi:AraC-like DNA-binding protein
MLADLTDLSLPRFKAFFKRERIPPAEYVLRERVTKAESRLLRSNESITNIAYHLGFSNSQYFATVVKRFLGRTPTSFRRKGR